MAELSKHAAKPAEKPELITTPTKPYENQDVDGLSQEEAFKKAADRMLPGWDKRGD